MVSLKRTAVLAAVLVVGVVPARAQEAAVTFLKDWVATLDASPDWKASYASIESDGDATATISNFTVASEKPGLALSVATLAVTDFTPQNDGTLVAGALKIDGGEVNFGDILKLQMGTSEFRDFSLPPIESFAWTGDAPYLAIINALKPLTKIAMSTGRIGSFGIVQVIDGVESRTTYEQVNIDGWKDGKIAAIGAGPIMSQTPDKDQLMAMRVAAAQSRDIDLNAMFHVYDPANYVDGKGDGVWRQAVGKATYRDMIVAVPGVTFTMKEAVAEGLKVRQMRSGVDILSKLGTPGYEDLSEKPEEAFKLLQLIAAHGLDSLSMTGMSVKAPGVETATLEGFTITDWTSDKLGEMAIDRLALSIQDQGKVSIQRFAFGDLVPPSIEAIVAAAMAEDSGGDVDVGSVIPQLGFIEAQGISAAPSDAPPLSVERFRLDLKDYVGPIPTNFGFELVDADVDASLIEDEDAKQMLDKLGYDRVVLDAAVHGTWSQAGEIALDSFAFTMKDVGTISGDIVLSGIAPADYKLLQDQAALAALSFVRGSITAKDDSIVGRGLAMQAAEFGVDPEAFREQFAMGLPLMLAFLGDARLQSELAPVLAQFIKTPGGSLTMVANPVAPQNLMDLMMAGSSAPFELARMLNLTFSGIPGPTGPAPDGDTLEAPEHSAPLPEATPEEEQAPAPEPAPEAPAPEAPAKTNPDKGDTAQ